MAARVCPDCRAIFDPAATGSRAGRCPACSRVRDRARGGREARGYGDDHRRIRADLVQRQAAGETLICWRCGLPIVGAFHLGHDDRDRAVTRGPEHPIECNLRAAGRSSHRNR